MKWKTGIVNVNLIILVIGFMVASVVGCIMDKDFAYLGLKMFFNGLLGFIVTIFFAFNTHIRTDEQGIEYRTLWTKRSLNWNEIKSYQIVLGTMKLISTKNDIDIPIVWVKDKKSLVDLIKNHVSVDLKVKD